MGLDSFIYRQQADGDYSVYVPKGSRRKHLAYWRSATPIHRWFCVTLGVHQGDQPYPVSRAQLQGLLDECAAACKGYKAPVMRGDRPYRQAVIPDAQAHLFVGRDGTLDDGFIWTVRGTRTMLRKILSKPGDEFVYLASW